MKIRLFKTIVRDVSESVRVNISAFVGFQTALRVNKSNGLVQQHNETFSCGDKEWTPVGSFVVRPGDKSNWVEIDLDPVARKEWIRNLTSSLFKVAVKVECKEELPMMIENPAVKISRSGGKLQNNTLPYLLLYMNDSNTKFHIDETVAIDRNPIIHSQRSTSFKEAVNKNPHQQEKRSTEKRSTSGGCYHENITIHFKTLGIHYVLTPRSFVTKMCLGACSFQYLQLNPLQGNNHARIMAALASYPELVGANSTQPENPCCVPTKYGNIYLLEQEKDFTVELKPYYDIVVSECGCR